MWIGGQDLGGYKGQQWGALLWEVVVAYALGRPELYLPCSVTPDRPHAP